MLQWWWWCRASCPRMSVDVLGTNCDQCRSMVQCCFTSTETVRLIRTKSPGRPPRLSHSSWTWLWGCGRFSFPSLPVCFPVWVPHTCLSSAISLNPWHLKLRNLKRRPMSLFVFFFFFFFFSFFFLCTGMWKDFHIKTHNIESRCVTGLGNNSLLFQPCGIFTGWDRG